MPVDLERVRNENPGCNFDPMNAGFIESRESYFHPIDCELRPSTKGFIFPSFPFFQASKSGVCLSYSPTCLPLGLPSAPSTWIRGHVQFVDLQYR